MTKVPDDGEDTIYSSQGWSFRAMARRNGERPALDWFNGLSKKGKGQVLAAFEVVVNSIQSGRPPAGRAEKLVTSSTGLWELKVTKPGATAPHLRMLYRRVGNTLWAAVGFVKQKNQLTKEEVRAGDAIAEEWDQRNDD